MCEACEACVACVAEEWNAVSVVRCAASSAWTGVGPLAGRHATRTRPAHHRHQIKLTPPRRLQRKVVVPALVAGRVVMVVCEGIVETGVIGARQGMWQGCCRRRCRRRRCRHFHLGLVGRCAGGYDPVDPQTPCKCARKGQWNATRVKSETRTSVRGVIRGVLEDVGMWVCGRV